MSSPSNSPPYSHANVKYKTYQSKRNSVGSVSSLNALTLPAGPTPPPSSNEPSARKRASSFARPAARPQNNPPVTSPGSSNLPLSSTGQNVAPIRTTLHQINGPSPLGRANPSTNDLDRFPKSPPPSASPKPFFAGLQSPNPTVSSLPASRSITPPTTAFNTPSRPQQKAPYLAGFQAKGAVRIRTEEFHTARQSGSEGKKLEQARLQRRLEKVTFPCSAALPNSLTA